MKPNLKFPGFIHAKRKASPAPRGKHGSAHVKTHSKERQSEEVRKVQFREMSPKISYQLIMGATPIEYLNLTDKSFRISHLELKSKLKTIIDIFTAEQPNQFEGSAMEHIFWQLQMNQRRYRHYEEIMANWEANRQCEDIDYLVQRIIEALHCSLQNIASMFASYILTQSQTISVLSIKFTELVNLFEEEQSNMDLKFNSCLDRVGQLQERSILVCQALNEMVQSGFDIQQCIRQSQVYQDYLHDAIQYQGTQGQLINTPQEKRMEEMPHALSQAKAKAALNLSLPLYNLLIKPIDTIFTQRIKR